MNSTERSEAALRLCVLISGSGTNLQALIDAREGGHLNTEIVHVISNNPAATGLQRADKAGIACSILDHRSFGSRPEFDRALATLMSAHQPDLFVFAGFMRIVGEPVVANHRGRMINLHPSLLPLYPGLDTYQRAIDAGDSEHGASIHFLTRQLDGGPVISQVRIPLHASDTSGTLCRRLAPEEHRLVVATIELFCHRRVEFRDDQVVIDGVPRCSPLVLDESPELNG